MLVLSRKRDESIMIGDNIEVTVLHVHPHRVRIGIKAPSHIKVLRSELATHAAPEESESPADEGFLTFDIPREAFEAGRTLVPK